MCCCCCYGVGQQVPKSDPIRLTFLRSIRPENTPPNSVSYRARSGGHGPVLRASLSDNFVLEFQTMSFYDLLGIPRTGSLTEIKQAYKQLARKYHPDVSPPGRVEDYTERFIQVKEAYETLSDPRMREMYDRHIANGEHLAFTARRAKLDVGEMDDKSEWRNRWQTQLSGLKARSVQKDSDDNMSWGARMRRERNE